MPEWANLATALNVATGPDAVLDHQLAEAFGLPEADYTGSVEHSRHLAEAVLPGWRLHLGFGATGVVPYAIISHGGQRGEAEGPTIPLALLRAVLAGLCRNGDA